MDAAVLHYPTLKTVLQIERIIKSGETVMTRNELKRRLPTQIMHQSLQFVLEYLEASNKIIIGSKGICWIQQDSPKLKRLLQRSVRVA